MSESFTIYINLKTLFIEFMKSSFCCPIPINLTLWSLKGSNSLVFKQLWSNSHSRKSILVTLNSLNSFRFVLRPWSHSFPRLFKHSMVKNFWFTDETSFQQFWSNYSYWKDQCSLYNNTLFHCTIGSYETLHNMCKWIFFKMCDGQIL